MLVYELFFSRSYLARFVLRKKRDDTTPTTNTKKQCEHHKDSMKHTQPTQASTHTTHITQHDQRSSLEMMELVSLHHGGHLITPHRAPLRGGVQSRPTPGEASPAMEDTNADAHGWGGGYNTIEEVVDVAHSPCVSSTGLPPDLPLLDLKTNQSDHRTPKEVVLALRRTLRKVNHLQTRPQAAGHHPADATPHSQGV
jgi:hypothetical protein